MSKPIYHPPQDRFTLLLWGRVALYSLISVLLIIFLFCCSGCASPGKVGFRQLRQQNTHEKRVLKAVAVQSGQIARHTDRALRLADSLAATHLDPAQVKLEKEIRLELQAVKLENTGLVKQLDQAHDIIVQRDATITQTQAEVRQSWWEKRVHDLKVLGLGVVVGLFLYGLLHALLLAAKTAVAVYAPEVPAAAAVVEAVVKKG